MKRSQSSSLLQGGMAKTALIESFIKLNPTVMFRNPVMFAVELGTVVMFFVCLQVAFGGDTTQGSLTYNLLVFAILLLTLLFANFAEALAHLWLPEADGGSFLCETRTGDDDGRRGLSTSRRAAASSV